MPKLLLTPGQIVQAVSALVGTKPKYRTPNGWRWRENHSLSVTTTGLWYDFETGEGGLLVDLVARELSCSKHDAYVWLGLPPLYPVDTEAFNFILDDIPEPETPPPTDPDETLRKRIAFARFLVSEAAPDIVGTPAERYLTEQRGLDKQSMPDGRWPDHILWHAERRLLLVCVHDFITGDLTGIQTISLNDDGTPVRDENTGRKRKRSYGRIAGNAVRFGWQDSTRIATLGLAEGVETALSAAAMLGIPVWATLGTSNMRRTVIPLATKNLILIGDSDTAGRAAIIEAAAELARPGLRIQMLEPEEEEKDANDVLLMRKKNGIAIRIDWQPDDPPPEGFRIPDPDTLLTSAKDRKVLHALHWQTVPSFRPSWSNGREPGYNPPRKPRP